MFRVIITIATSVLACVVAIDPGNGRILTPEGGTREFAYDEYNPGESSNDVDVNLGEAVTTPASVMDVAVVLGRILEDRYLRRPMAVVVDNGPASLARAVELLEAGLRRVHNEAVYLTLLPYNSTGPGPVHKIMGTPWLRQVLSFLREQQIGSVPYYTTLKASEQVPVDSAILLFTARQEEDGDLAQLTTTTLAAKRCKLFVFWCGGEASAGSIQPQYLREVANLTGGGFYVAYPDAPMSPNVREDRPIKSNKVTLAVRRGIAGNSELPLKVDSTVHALNIAIAGPVTTAILRPPSGGPIDLLTGTALQRLVESGNIRVLTNTSELVQLLVTTSALPPGTWFLGTSGVSPNRRYNVTVTADSRLSFSASIHEVAKEDGGAGSSRVRLTFVGVGDVAEVSLVDENGQEIERLNYQRREDSVVDPKGQVTTDLDLLTEVRSTSPIYVKLAGQDPTGAEFTRVSLLERQVQVLPTQQTGLLQPVTIELGTNSSLNVLPNYWAQITFEVTNNRNEPTQYYFGARDEKGFIRSIQPTRLVIGPLQTTNVAVHMMSPAGTAYGTIDTVTLLVTTTLNQRFTKAALITIGDRVSDSERPYVAHTIKSDCSNFLNPSTCQSRVWSTEITIEDRNSGLLRVTSIPRGIQFRSEFIAGTKSAVTAYYSATCCETRVDVTATDTLGNYVKYSINADATFIGLNQAEVAAVSLGSIVLILLIIIIILAVCLCRNRKSRDLPVLRSRSTR